MTFLNYKTNPRQLHGVDFVFQYIVSFCTFFRDAFSKVDGTGGADNAAEVTTDTLGADDAGLAGFAVEDNGLMAAVVA